MKYLEENNFEFKNLQTICLYLFAKQIENKMLLKDEKYFKLIKNIFILIENLSINNDED